MEIDHPQAVARRAACCRSTERNVRLLQAGSRAAVEESVRKFVLTAADGRLVKRPLAMRGDPGAELRLVLGRGRPRGGQQQRVDFRVSGVDRRRRREIAEVAVEVRVVLVDSAAVRKSMRIERMHEEHRGSGVVDRAHERIVVQIAVWHPEPQ